MSESNFKPKKSVALSGVAAGNTALCTVGRSGNDLNYRGYDILDIAETCEFEELAHLLVHGTLPNVAELAGYKAKLKALRGLPSALRTILEAVPAAAHPMDVMRTGVSALGAMLPEKDDHNEAGARDIADRLMASLGSMLLYWHHFSQNGRRIEVETDDDTIAAHFLSLLHGTAPRDSWVRAMHTSLNLYAEHEYNASTFACRVVAGTGSDMYSAVTGGIGALRGPKHGGANEVAFEVQKAQQRQELIQSLRQQRVQEYLTNLRESVKVDDHRTQVLGAIRRQSAPCPQQQPLPTSKTKPRHHRDDGASFEFGAVNWSNRSADQSLGLGPLFIAEGFHRR